ncbi:hypothetical protein EVAR_33431_1 [Eumeta japonica]|uniref:Uncharacterized protein n=1 Tax=Eumeta variegata TaxID=151549 RepID=A0A4C1W1Q7_EUMVA|nr:hypothetical protein EVAR_33431_1 [Eumeta japonica]
MKKKEKYSGMTVVPNKELHRTSSAKQDAEPTLAGGGCVQASTSEACAVIRSLNINAAHHFTYTARNAFSDAINEEIRSAGLRGGGEIAVTTTITIVANALKCRQCE